MAMKVSLQGAMEIISHEGIVPVRYKDSVGVWTIGVGHTAAAGPPDPATFAGRMTITECIDLFRRDLAKYEAGVNAAFTRPLKQHEFDAAVSFHYNTGAIGRATWVKLFNAGDRVKAVAAIMNWTKPPEIKKRRQAEQALFDRGVYSGGGFAMIYPADANGKVLWNSGTRVDLRALYGSTVQLPPPDVPPVDKPTPKPSQGLWDGIVALVKALFRVR